MKLYTMKERENNPAYRTGIMVKACNSEGHFGPADISQLQPGSLLEWLRSRGGENVWAEQVIFTLFGHDQTVIKDSTE